MTYGKSKVKSKVNLFTFDRTFYAAESCDIGHADFHTSELLPGNLEP